MAGQGGEDREVAAREAEVVQPRQLPDGLLEVRLEGEPRDDLFLIEVATFPERRVGQQLTGDLMLVYLDRGELPEAVTLVLRPKGSTGFPKAAICRRHGLSSCRLKWRRGVVDDSWRGLAAGRRRGPDPVGATDGFPDPPETMMQRCRNAIDQHAPPGEKANLLAVTQVLAYLRYNDLGLLTIVNVGTFLIRFTAKDLRRAAWSRVRIGFRPYTPHFQKYPRSALIAAGVESPHIRNVTRQPKGQSCPTASAPSRPRVWRPPPVPVPGGDPWHGSARRPSRGRRCSEAAVGWSRLRREPSHRQGAQPSRSPCPRRLHRVASGVRADQRRSRSPASSSSWDGTHRPQPTAASESWSCNSTMVPSVITRMHSGSSKNTA